VAIAVDARTVGAVKAQDKDADFAAYMGDQQTAEDLVQTALAKLYLSWDRVQRRELVDGYVRRILVNEHNSLWRRSWKRREVTTEHLPDRPAPYAEPDDGQGRALWEFVQTLPKKQRAAIVLRYYEELSEAETAAVLGVSVGTVKSQTSRALATMRSRVGEHPTLSRAPEEER